MPAQQEADRYGNVSDKDNRRVDFCEQLQTRKPVRVRESDRLERAPESVEYVEIDSANPDDVDNAVVPLAEKIDDELVRVRFFTPEKTLQLHFRPEVAEVH